MLQPKKTKYQKSFRGKMRGLAQNGNSLSHGEYGLQAIDRAMINGRQIEAARKAIVRNNKRKGKLWISVFPHKPMTKKPAEVTMGNGKGAVDHYVAVIKPGRVLFEIGGLEEDVAKRSLELAAQKLPIKCRIIKR